MAAIKNILITYLQLRYPNNFELQEQVQEKIMVGELDISIEEMEKYIMDKQETNKQFNRHKGIED